MSFRVRFDIDEGAEAYIQNIQDLRRRLAQGDDIEGVGTLAPQVPPGGALTFFDVVLSYTDGPTYELTVRLRTDNLYLVGWRRPNTDVWYELGHEGGGAATIIDPGTTTQLLSLQENYHGLTQAAGWALRDVPLSASRIGGAVRTLATTAIGANTDWTPIARSVLILAFTVAEATRLRTISTMIEGAWWNESSPGMNYAAQVRSWSRLSNAVQRTRNEGHSWDFNGESTQIWAFVAAIGALGIMHYIDTTGSSRTARSITGTTDNHEAVASTSTTTWAQGQPLLEIFYVRINDIDGEDPGNLYGDIEVIDSVNTAPLWSRKSDEYVDIKPGQDVLLEGPNRALSAADEVGIKLNLFDYDSLSPNDPIAQGTILFAPFDYYTKYDVVNNVQVNGTSGSATVSYMAISDGLYAQITVVLINGDGEDPANVYGDITTNNGHGQSQLFLRDEDNYIDVAPNSPIPQVRTIVAVPTRGTLRVNAKLWDQDSLSPDDEIANGSAEFQPLYKKSESKRITGAYGEVEVQVTWM